MDFQAVCELTARAVADAIGPLIGTPDAGRNISMGADGTPTKYIDLVAEECILEHLTRYPLCRTLISEEPEGYEPDRAVIERVAKATKVLLTEEPEEAVEGADVINTDVWASMGQEAEAEQRKRAFHGYCVDAQLLKLAKPGAIFLHCLPAHRGEEVTDEVIEGPQSRVFDEVENRLHVQKALMEYLLLGREVE